MVTPAQDISTSTPERILVAAEEVFSSLPLPKVTMEDVAQAAGVSRQTVYAHFGSKDELIVSMFVFEMERTHVPALRRIAEREPTVERLFEMFSTELRLARELPFIGHTFDAAFTPKIADLVLGTEPIERCRQDLWQPILTRYRDAGIVRDDIDLERFVHWMTYQYVWLLSHPTALGDGDERDRYLRDFLLGAAIRQDR